MFGLSTAPSRYTPWSLSEADWASSTFSVTAAHTSMLCLPLGTISGSTMGQRPWRWQMDAYRERLCTHSVIARSEGRPFAGSYASSYYKAIPGFSEALALG